MQEKEFKVRKNLPVGIFLFMITVMLVFNIYYLVAGKYTYTSGGVTRSFNYGIINLLIYVLFLAAMYYYFLGCRPYKYVVKDKELISKKRLFPDKHVDLMKAEIVTDAVPRLADLVTRPHAIEVYDDTKKRYKYFPEDAGEFAAAIVASNKRIHCTVKAYTDKSRNIRRRDERKRRR